MMSMARAYLQLHGRTQGAQFPACIQAKAEEHAITGWIRRCGAQEHEAMLEGAVDGIHHLLEFALHGLPDARISVMDVRYGDYRGEFVDFRIRQPARPALAA